MNRHLLGPSQWPSSIRSRRKPHSVSRKRERERLYLWPAPLLTSESSNGESSLLTYSLQTRMIIFREENREEKSGVQLPEAPVLPSSPDQMIACFSLIIFKSHREVSLSLQTSARRLLTLKSFLLQFSSRSF